MGKSNENSVTEQTVPVKILARLHSLAPAIIHLL